MEADYQAEPIFVSNHTTAMSTSAASLSNAQLELLRLFSSDLSPKDLLELKQILVEFLAQKAVKAADKAWDEQGWTQEDVDRLLKTKLRAKSGK